MERSVTTYSTLDEWIAREALPFSLDAPESFDHAVDKLIAALGDATELLGFGEALHGGEEFLILRNRLFRRLVEAHGYSAIAIESSFPRGLAIDEYVAGRGPATYDAVRDVGISHGFGRLEANRELVEWMRRYNADPARRGELRFYGFDSPTEIVGTDSPRRDLEAVLDYLAAQDREDDGARRARIGALLGPDDAWEQSNAMLDPARSIGLSPAATTLRVETEELIAELRRRRPELEPASGRARYAEARHSAESARQLLGYHAATARDMPDRNGVLLGLRDVMMADNLIYILERERERGKVLAFAHNGHVQRGEMRWQAGADVNRWWPAGAHLAARLGPRYAVIGAAVSVSAANGIGQPEVGTLEARLTAAPGPGRLIPTHAGAGLPGAESTAMPTRSGSAKNPSYFALTPRSLADFDALAILDTATYSRGGPTLP